MKNFLEMNTKPNSSEDFDFNFDRIAVNFDFYIELPR